MSSLSLYSAKKKRTSEGYLSFITRAPGMRQIVSPCMEILTRSRRTGEEVQAAKIDPKEPDSEKITDRNDLWADPRTSSLSTLAGE
jgi:hypothetical protein